MTNRLKKKEIDQFIQKYYLNGTNERVKWLASSEGLSTIAISEDQHLIVNILAKNINISNGEYYIYDTTQLLSLLSVLHTDIAITVNDKRTFTFQDDDTKAKATVRLANPVAVTPVPKFNPPSECSLQVKLNQTTMTTFIRAKGALNEVEHFAVLASNDSASLVIGYDESTPTDNVAIDVDAQINSPLVAPVYFSTEHFKNILAANKEAESGSINVYSKGLLHITFDIAGYNIDYYLMAKKG